MLLSRGEFRRLYLTDIMDPFDKRWHYERYEPGLWIKHQIAHHVAPTKIVEIGVRAGYSAWAMIAAAPDAQFVGYDNYSPDYRENGVEVSKEFEAWAHRILDPLGVRIVKTDTQAETFAVEEADLFNVDGNHNYECELRDVRNCVSAGKPGAVIVVHDYQVSHVRTAVADATVDVGWTVVEVHEKRNGDALIFNGPVPDWVAQLEVD